MKSNNVISNSGLLDNGYGGLTVKMGWQPTDQDGWASRYGYPSYGLGYYSGFLSDTEVFGNPNAVFGFIKFPLSSSDRRNVFAISPSFGLVYNLNPYDSETNPLNTAIGAKAAFYFNLDFGFTYKWTRELDILYGFDFSHFSNGSTYKPNNGLNLYGLNLGLKYNYNAGRKNKKEGLYEGDLLPARFKRPKSSPTIMQKGSSIVIYLAAGLGQNNDFINTDRLLPIFAGMIGYEYEFSEKHAITGGLDLFYDSRLQGREISERWLSGMHVGYDFRFHKFAIKMQVGTYLGDDKGKGGYFLRPGLRYNVSPKLFLQLGLKTLDGGSADAIEYGIGYRPFSL